MGRTQSLPLLLACRFYGFAKFFERAQDHIYGPIIRIERIFVVFDAPLPSVRSIIFGSYIYGTFIKIDIPPATVVPYQGGGEVICFLAFCR